MVAERHNRQGQQRRGERVQLSLIVLELQITRLSKPVAGLGLPLAEEVDLPVLLVIQKHLYFGARQGATAAAL